MHPIRVAVICSIKLHCASVNTQNNFQTPHPDFPAYLLNLAMSSKLESLLRLTIQLSLIKHWTAPSTYHDAIWHQDMLRTYFPSFLDVTTRHLPHSSPEEMGRFFAVIYDVVNRLAYYLLQDRFEHDIGSYCEELRRLVSARSPGISTGDIKLTELSVLLRRIMECNAVADPSYARTRADLGSMESAEQQDAGTIFALRLANHILYAMIDVREHHSAMHRLWSFREYVDFTRAFRREMRDVELDEDQVHFEVNDTATEYLAVGIAVPYFDFCELVDTVPEDLECSVCLNEIEARSVEHPAVVTMCKHFFHKKCLTAWVNESGMTTSNTCPTCRVVLCEPRQRIHVSQLIERSRQAAALESIAE